MVLTLQSANAETLRWDSLQLFTFVWAVAIIVHASTFEPHLTRSPMSFVVLFAAIALVFNARSLPLLLSLAVLQLVEFVATSPYVSNHWHMVAFLHIYLVILIAAHLLRKGRTQREAVYKQLAAGGQVLLIGLYFFATFHKLNLDFVNPAISCGASLYRDIADFYQLPQSNLMESLAIVGTYVFEAGIPLLLLFRRTRLLGITVGLGFHMALGLGGFYDFSTIVFAFYVFYLPDDFIERFAQRNKAILQWMRGKRWLGVIVLSLIIGFSIRWFFGSAIHPRYVAPLWFGGTMILVVLYLRVVGIRRLATWKQPGAFRVEPFRRTPALALAIFALMLSVGFSPYIGLKNNVTFDMYSNLQAEYGLSNHFIMPAQFQVLPYTYDVVQILDSEDPMLQEVAADEILLPRIEVLRITRDRQQYQSIIQYNDQRLTLPADLATLGTYHPLEFRFLYFEPIETNQQTACSW